MIPSTRKAMAGGRISARPGSGFRVMEKARLKPQEPVLF